MHRARRQPVTSKLSNTSLLYTPTFFFRSEMAIKSNTRRTSSGSFLQCDMWLFMCDTDVDLTDFLQWRHSLWLDSNTSVKWSPYRI